MRQRDATWPGVIARSIERAKLLEERLRACCQLEDPGQALAHGGIRIVCANTSSIYLCCAQSSLAPRSE